MNITNRTLLDIEMICNNLIKVSEHNNYFLIGLDTDKIGLNLTYNDILYIMKKFYDKILFCSNLKGIKSIKLQNHLIILNKW